MIDVYNIIGYDNSQNWDILGIARQHCGMIVRVAKRRWNIGEGWRLVLGVSQGLVHLRNE